MRKITSFYLLLFCFTLPILSSAEKAAKMDAVTFNGTTVTGCIKENNGVGISIDTFAGIYIVPSAKIESVTRSNPGESCLVFGLQLMKQGSLERARNYLQKAQGFSSWRKTATDALNQLEDQVQKNKEVQSNNEKQEIENLIRQKGLQAGIKALKTKYQQENEYWGSFRGKLHLMMAKERLDHLDVKEAEMHLALAEQYGIEPEKWQKVKDEIVAVKRQNLLYGKSFDIAKLFPKPKPKIEPKSSTLTALAAKAQSIGEKTPPIEWLQCVEYHAKVNELDPLLVWAVIATESNWEPKAVSKVGAQGLMQLMPGTAGDLNISDPFDPKENIQGGTKYMKFLIEMFNDTDTALAAYNVGPGTVERANGITPAGQRYITKVRTRYAALKKRFGVS